MRSYPVLKMYAGLLRFIGWATIVIGVIVGIVVGSSIWRGFDFLWFAGTVIGFAIFSLAFFVTAELLTLAMDIAQDVSQMNRGTSEVRKRLDDLNELTRRQTRN